MHEITPALFGRYQATRAYEGIIPSKTARSGTRYYFLCGKDTGCDGVTLQKRFPPTEGGRGPDGCRAREPGDGRHWAEPEGPCQEGAQLPAAEDEKPRGMGAELAECPSHGARSPGAAEEKRAPSCIPAA